MLLFDWTKIYDVAQGNIFTCNQIMEMIITNRIPKNKLDPLYKYSRINLSGRNFLLHPDILLFNAYKYEQREIAIYYALAAIRPIAEYKALGKTRLDLEKVPVDIEQITDNRLLRIENNEVIFLYEEVNPKEIH